MGKLEDRKDFIKNIIDSTLSENLKWISVKSIFNNYKRQKYKLSLNNSLYLTYEVNLDRNSNTIFLYDVDSMLDHYSVYDYPYLKNLFDFLKKDFLTNVKRDIPDCENDDFYKNLSKNFTKRSFRKSKLENILSDNNYSETKTEYVQNKEISSKLGDVKEKDNLWMLCIPILGILHYFLSSIDNKYKPVILSYFLLQIVSIIFLFLR